MNIIQQTTNGLYEVFLSGDFTFDDHTEFRDVITAITQESTNEIKFDLAQLEYVDSAALGMFLLARDEAKRLNKPICIKGAVGQVKKTLILARFDTLFSM